MHLTTGDQTTRCWDEDVGHYAKLFQNDTIPEQLVDSRYYTSISRDDHRSHDSLRARGRPHVTWQSSISSTIAQN